jgi:long-chain fatty acid transport protein
MNVTKSERWNGQAKRIVTPRCRWLLALMSSATLSSYGLGFRIPNQDAEATARGNAFVATADNPSAVYYNPAGITQIQGTEGQAGFHTISVNSHFEEAGTEARTDSRFAIQPVPQFYAVFSPDAQPYSFGLGVYVPYGLGLEWPETAPFRNFGLEGRLQYVTVSPVAAWKILPNLSIAAGPTVNYAQLRLRRGIGIVPGDEFRFKGDGWAFGGKAGIRWQPHEKLALGLSYVSPTSVNFGGNSGVRPIIPGASSTTVDVPFPQFVMAGISYRPTPKWNIEIGADWTDWDSVKTVTFKGTGFGDVPFPLNWKSTVMANLGVSRYLSNGYWVAAGYFFSPNSTSDKDFSPLIPDTDLHVGSLGFGHRGEHWGWAVSGQIIAGPERRVSNGNATDGTYQFFNQAVNVSVAYRF